MFLGEYSSFPPPWDSAKLEEKTVIFDVIPESLTPTWLSGSVKHFPVLSPKRCLGSVESKFEAVV